MWCTSLILRFCLVARAVGKIAALKWSSFGTWLLINFSTYHSIHVFWNLRPLKMITSAKFPNFRAITRLEMLDKQSGSCGLRGAWIASKERPRSAIFGFGNVKNETRTKKWSFTRVFVFAVLTLVPRSFSLQNIASQYNVTYCWSNWEFQTLLSFYSYKS